MTLYERRKSQRDEAIQELIREVEVLREAVKFNNTAELARRTAIVKKMADNAALAAILTDDLESVQDYGPEGGR